MPTPLVHALLPAACLATTAPSLPRLTRREWAKLAFAAMVLANAPDFDLMPGILFPSMWQTTHRFYGHNVFTVTLLILAGGWALRRWVTPALGVRQAYGIAAALVLSHLFLDSLSLIPPELARDPSDHGGIPLLFPFTTEAWKLPWGLFPGYAADPTKHPAVAYATARDYWGRVFFLEMRVLVAMLGSFAVLWHLPRLARRARRALEARRWPKGRLTAAPGPSHPSASAPTSAP